MSLSVVRHNKPLLSPPVTKAYLPRQARRGGKLLRHRRGMHLIPRSAYTAHHPTRSPSYAQLTPRATRREAVSLASLVLLSAVPTLPVLALDGGVTAESARAQSEAIGVEAAGGLAPGTGRPLNALIKMRAQTGVERSGAVESPLFKPGQCSALSDIPRGGRGAREIAHDVRYFHPGQVSALTSLRRRKVPPRWPSRSRRRGPWRAAPTSTCVTSRRATRPLCWRRRFPSRARSSL